MHVGDAVEIYLPSILTQEISCDMELSDVQQGLLTVVFYSFYAAGRIYIGALALGGAGRIYIGALALGEAGRKYIYIYRGLGPWWGRSDMAV